MGGVYTDIGVMGVTNDGVNVHVGGAWTCEEWTVKWDTWVWVKVQFMWI